MKRHFFQAIEVKYLGATDTKPSRWKASCAGGSITRGYDRGMGSAENAYAIAEALATKLDWLTNITLQGGVLKNGNYVFVLVQS